MLGFKQTEILNKYLDQMEIDYPDIKYNHNTAAFLEKKTNRKELDKLPMLAFGKGKKLFLATYGVHGNEVSSNLSFAVSPVFIYNFLKENYGDKIFDEIKYAGLLINPNGIKENSRYYVNENMISTEPDMNRMWFADNPYGKNISKKEMKRQDGTKYLLFEIPHLGGEYIPPHIIANEVLDKVINENSDGKIIHIDHHVTRWKDFFPYFEMPGTHAKGFNFDEFSKALETLKHSSLLFFRKGFLSLLGREFNPFYNLQARYWQSNPESSSAELEAVKINTDGDYVKIDMEIYGTLSEYLASKGIPSLIYEDPSRFHLPFSNEDMNKAIRRHVLVDLAAMHSLVSDTPMNGELKNLEEKLKEFHMNFSHYGKNQLMN